jgi:hypothetical protein
MTKYLISFPILAILALLIYFFVIALVPLVAAIVPNGHALQEHGAGAISAGECFSGGGTIRAQRINPVTHRSITACQAPNGDWFVHIKERNGKTVTMFPKEKLHSLKQILRYMENSGDLPK